MATVLAEAFYKSRYELIQQLIQEGYEIILVAPEAYNTIDKYFIDMPVKYYEVDFGRTKTDMFQDLKTIKKLIDIIKKEQPNLTYAFGGAKAAIYTTIASYRNNIDKNYCMVNGLGSIFRGSGFKNDILKFIMSILYKYSLSKSSGVLFQNPDDLKVFTNHNLVEPSKCKIVNGSGVNMDKFIYMSPPEDKMIFLFVGRLLKDKGIYEFIEAAKTIKAMNYNAEFWVVGGLDSNHTSVSKKEIRSWDEKGIVYYFGYQEDVSTFYEKCSVFVLPSYHEGTPRTSLEAMSTGRPVITTDAPGCRETVIDGENGFLVEVGSYKHLSEKIVFFLENPEKVEEMGLKSRQLVQKKYDSDKVNETIISFFNI